MFSADQYQAVRHVVGVIDRSARGKIALTGRDRASFLHALLTNDVLALKAGAGCYAAYLTPQGRMVADMRVVELGDRILLDVEPSVTASLRERLDQMIFSEDVQVTDLTEQLAAYGAHGPRAADVVAAVMDGGAADAKQPGMRLPRFDEFEQYQNVHARFRGAPAIIVRDDIFGEIGFDLYVGREHAGDLLAAVRAAGAIEFGADTADVLRIEAGRPLFGVDMDDSTIPLEAGIEDRAISFTKGCYVGQEVVVRILHRGHGRIARKLIGLVVDGADVPAANDLIVDAEKQIGHVTSAVPSPAIGKPTALGYVRRDYTKAGTKVTVVHEGRPLRAVVADLPFVKRR